MVKQVFVTASIAAGATADVTPTQIRSAPEMRRIESVGISGATVNTGLLRLRVNGVELTNNGIPNGVTRTAGQVIDQASDVIEINYDVNENEVIELLLTNTSAGALTYFVFYSILDASDME